MLGYTFLSAFTLLIPRSIWANKPDGLINYFTNDISPAYWEHGGSLPIGLHFEFLANFYILGLFLFLALLIHFDRLFIKYVNSIFELRNHAAVFGTSVCIIVFRGSGLDLAMLILLGSIVCITCMGKGKI